MEVPLRLRLLMTQEPIDNSPDGLMIGVQRTGPALRAGSGPPGTILSGRVLILAHDNRTLSFPITSAVVDSGATSAI